MIEIDAGGLLIDLGFHRQFIGKPYIGLRGRYPAQIFRRKFLVDGGPQLPSHGRGIELGISGGGGRYRHPGIGFPGSRIGSGTKLGLNVAGCAAGQDNHQEKRQERFRVHSVSFRDSRLLRAWRCMQLARVCLRASCDRMLAFRWLLSEGRNAARRRVTGMACHELSAGRRHTLFTGEPRYAGCRPIFRIA